MVVHQNITNLAGYFHFLNVRKIPYVIFPDSSLADLYDPLTMPPNLMKAHKSLDAAVMKLYGFSIKDMQEHDCVAELMKLYQMKQASKK